MNGSEVDSFFAAARRTIPASPEWRDGNRTGERRASLPVAVDGAISRIELVVTVKLNEPAYLMVGLVAGRQCCRLCMTTGHRDRRTGDTITESHFHSWEANRSGNVIPKVLHSAERLPPAVRGKDTAFAWFLTRTRIDHPRWLPVAWPHGQGLI